MPPEEVSFQDRLVIFRQNEEAGRARAEEFGQGLPVGEYLGRLQALSAGKSQSGNLQVHRELLVVDEGDHANEVSHDWMGLNHEVKVAIMTRFFEAHGFEMPPIIDEEASKGEGDFVFNQEFLDALQYLVDAAPTYRFRVRQSGQYRNLDILNIEDYGTLEAPEEGGAAPIAEGADTAGPATAAIGAAADPLRERAVEFAMSVGLEVTDADDLEAIKAKINECVFPIEGVTTEDLAAQGLGDDNSRYTEQQVMEVEAIGCPDAVIRPAAKPSAPPPPPARRAAPPARRAAPAPAQKRAPARTAAAPSRSSSTRRPAAASSKGKRPAPKKKGGRR
jgi:hypothetical protein